MKNFYREGAKTAKKDFETKKVGIPRIEKLFFAVLRDLRVFAVNFLIILLFFLSLLAGCTLLFVEKPQTRYVANPAPQATPAKSLSTQISHRPVLSYKVQEGDTLESVAFIYYNHASKAGLLA